MFSGFNLGVYHRPATRISSSAIWITATFRLIADANYLAWLVREHDLQIGTDRKGLNPT